MISYEQATDIRNDIESALISYCDYPCHRMDNNSISTPDELFRRYSNVCSDNEIVYFVRDVVSSHMHNPTSPIFKYVCRNGINSEFITNNTTLMSRDEFIDFCMNHVETFPYYDDYNTISISFINMMMSTLDCIYDIQEYEDISDSNRIETFHTIEEVITTLQILYHIVIDTVEFCYNDESDLIGLPCRMADDDFPENVEIFVDKDKDVDSNWCLDLICRIITEIIRYGELPLDAGDDLETLFMALNLEPGDMTFSGVISTLQDLFTITHSFCSLYNSIMNQRYSQDSIYFIEKTWHIIYSCIEENVNSLIGIIFQIETYPENFERNRETVWAIYACVYDNIVLPYARRYLSYVS
jgi:hypothetical protein